MRMGEDIEDIEVVEEYRIAHPDLGTVEQVTIIRVPESDKFPEGIKSRLHYGTWTGTTTQ
jgi:hypothetical protein